MQPIVGVEKHQELGIGQRGAVVSLSREALIGLAGDDQPIRSEALASVNRRRIGRSVIDENHVAERIGLVESRVDGILDVLSVVETGDDDVTLRPGSAISTMSRALRAWKGPSASVAVPIAGDPASTG